MPDRVAEYEGTVTPAFLRTMSQNKAQDFLSKLPLRMGRIIKVHAPTDSSSRSGFVYEYDVLVEEGSENSVATRTVIPHCWIMSELGGAADFTRSTLRALETDKQDMGNFGYGNRVLVLLVNASSFAGVIVGGIQHSLGEKDDPSLGHHQTKLFNGLRWEIDKDGQLHLTFGGSTDITGKPNATNDPTAAGTALELLKTGFNVTTPKDVTLTAGGNIAFTANTGTVQTNSLFVKLGAATDQMIKGTTYRAAETASNSSIAAALGACALAMTALAANPTVSPDLPQGPICATFVAAAAALTAAAGAIAAFEAGSVGYLSLKNSLD